MPSVTQDVIVETKLLTWARELANELEALYQQRVNDGADPIAESQEARSAFYAALVGVGMTPRDALRVVGRYL